MCGVPHADRTQERFICTQETLYLPPSGNIPENTKGEFLMSAAIAKTFLLQNLESVVPLAATFALRAMMSLMLHWEMQGGHRSGHKKEENDTEAEKND